MFVGLRRPKNYSFNLGYVPGTGELAQFGIICGIKPPNRVVYILQSGANVTSYWLDWVLNRFIDVWEHHHAHQMTLDLTLWSVDTFGRLKSKLLTNKWTHTQIFVGYIYDFISRKVSFVASWQGFYMLQKIVLKKKCCRVNG